VFGVFGVFGNRIEQIARLLCKPDPQIPEFTLINVIIIFTYFYSSSPFAKFDG
jgi:hypothetical protein